MDDGGEFGTYDVSDAFLAFGPIGVLGGRAGGGSTAGVFVVGHGEGCGCGLFGY